jgi:hypothetical protein
MIDMSMRDEDMAHAQQIASTERRQVAQIEQQGTSLMERFHVQSRIAEAPVDE